ncbi:NAD(P)-dependent oxidoreductase [Mycolicibacterium goodii]
MVRRFLDGDRWRLHLIDTVADRTAPFRDHPRVSIHERLMSLPQDIDFIFLCLPNAEALRGVINEIASRKSLGATVVVNLSTVGRQALSDAADALIAAGYGCVDAPVSGGAEGARTGSLTVMVSGNRATVEQCSAVFDVIANKVIVIGDKPGQAQAVKVANNVLSLGALVATAEATAITRKAGIPLDTALEALNASSGRNSATAVKFPRHVLTGRFDFGFPTSGALKDVSLFLELATELGVNAPLGAAVQAIWHEAAKHGFGQQDCTHIVSFYAAMAGLAEGLPA